MIDIFGQQLNIGDVVAFNEPNYSGLVIGTIIKFTPKMVGINFHKNKDYCTRYPLDVVKRYDLF